jgi:hypothetical protein
MRKTLLLLFGAIALCLAFASCSQDEQDVPMATKCEKVQTVEELTAQLKAYNTQFGIKSDALAYSTSRTPRLNLWDKLKIGLADAVGATVGALFAGPYGSILSGVVASYQTRLRILNEKQLKIEKVKHTYSDAFIGNGIYGNFTDSLGCYHNIAENALHSFYDNKFANVSDLELFHFCDSKMGSCSDGYRKNTVINASMIDRMIVETRPIYYVPYKEDMAFSEYCNNLKMMNPNKSAYIDYMYEYLFAMAYGNIEDAEQYTYEVLLNLKNSNASELDRGALTDGILTAYASLLYSASIEYQSK